MKNLLEVERGDFAEGIRTFRVRTLPDSAMLAFENGFLSIEAGERLVTLRAQGEWHGRARFSSNMLKALARFPPTANTIVITYDSGKLRIGSTVIACEWELVSKAFIKDATKPSKLDLLAMDRSSPRSEVLGSDLSKRIDQAHNRLAEKIKKAAELLKDAEISEEDLWHLVERQIQRRFEAGRE